jgi:hypothetical protein
MRLTGLATIIGLTVALATTGVVAGSGAVAAPADPAPPIPALATVPFGGDMTTLAPNQVFRLSPQLAAMLGTSTLDASGLARLRAAARPQLAGESTPPVGTTLLWPALDAARGIPPGIYLKPYSLRAVGQHLEVWVASGCDAVSCGTHFPAGDCREKEVPDSATVTDEQIKYLVGQFDSNMYPKETAAFSKPPDHNGSSTIPGIAAAGLDFAGNGEHTVALIDNIRQPNFYEFPKNLTYIAGFYAPLFNQITDRNVITVDAYDWIHRTGPNPANEPSSDLCRSRPAHPFTYEAVFGHEWQHLLEHYQNPDQATWVNEGLSMFAEALDGYTDTRRGITQSNSQPQLLCFQGYGIVKGPSNPNPHPCGGPAESLTLWGDQGDSDPILANYGDAWSFMLFCYDRFGLDFMSALHRDGKDVGLADVQTQLDKFAGGLKVETLLHQFQLMNLIDHWAKNGKVEGIDRNLVTAKDLDATLNLENPAAIGTQGTAPNGADYVQLATGQALQFAFSGNQKVNAAAADPNDPTSSLGGGGGEAPAVDGWYVSLVGIDAGRHRVLVTSHAGPTWTPDAATLAKYRSFPRVVAVIAHDDPTDNDNATEQHAGYSLKVNGHTEGSGEDGQQR